MLLSGSGFASVALGSGVAESSPSNDEARSPIVTEISGVSVQSVVRMDSLRITDTLGQPVTASFELINYSVVVGQTVRIRYFSEVLFAGVIDHVTVTSDSPEVIRRVCECRDWSAILLRRKLRRNFTDATVASAVSSILENELIGEGLSIGTIESRASVPLIDSQGGTAFDVFRSVAAATGQTFYVGYDKTIHFRSTTVPVAPLALDEARVLHANTQVGVDTETYRNRQIVVVNGTPVGNEAAKVVSVQRDNAAQISARAALEGGTGIYEEIEEITHPTSNEPGALTLLGLAYANLRLIVSGTPRSTVSCLARGYGFRAGQVAAVTLPVLGIVGTFVIQRMSLAEASATELYHTLELTNSSAAIRAYEDWLGIVQGGKVTVQMPSAITANAQTFDVPGSASWIVPAGVTTVEVLCYGAGGGGGGGLQYTPGNGSLGADGGNGGNGGLAQALLSVTPGETLDVMVGAKGSGGAADNGIPLTSPEYGNPGTAGTVTYVKRGALIVCQANSGDGGGAPYYYFTYTPSGTPGGWLKFNGSDGAPGSGAGDAVSVGGGRVGGAPGTRSPLTSGAEGKDGLIEIRW